MVMGVRTGSRRRKYGKVAPPRLAPWPGAEGDFTWRRSKLRSDLVCAWFPPGMLHDKVGFRHFFCLFLFLSLNLNGKGGTNILTLLKPLITSLIISYNKIIHRLKIATAFRTHKRTTNPRNNRRFEHKHPKEISVLIIFHSGHLHEWEGRKGSHNR